MVSIPFPDLLDVAGLADINVINAVEQDWLYQAIDIQVVSKVGKHYSTFWSDCIYSVESVIAIPNSMLCSSL